MSKAPAIALVYIIISERRPLATCRVLFICSLKSQIRALTGRLRHRRVVARQLELLGT